MEVSSSTQQDGGTQARRSHQQQQHSHRGGASYEVGRPHHHGNSGINIHSNSNQQNTQHQQRRGNNNSNNNNSRMPVSSSIPGAGNAASNALLSASDIEFILHQDKLEGGSEMRTTIMVRNIPNKYTQKMLLDEVNVNHRGTYDFFYLPIDFKNKCNVGYCFVNFIDAKSIVGFVNEFNGHRWKNFNSDKVCAVTFARIQGKAAMIARFQNSSLLEKDDEYRPLLFHTVTAGDDCGRPEAFPSAQAHKQHGHKVQTQVQSPTKDSSSPSPSSDFDLLVETEERFKSLELTEN